jgi:hypothetical protein
VRSPASGCHSARDGVIWPQLFKLCSAQCSSGKELGEQPALMQPDNHVGLFDDARCSISRCCAHCTSIRVIMRGLKWKTPAQICCSFSSKGTPSEPSSVPNSQLWGPVLHWGIYRWGYLYNYYSACCRHHSDIAHVVYEHLLHPSRVGRVMPLPLHRLTVGSTFVIAWSSDFDALSLPDQTSFYGGRDRSSVPSPTWPRASAQRCYWSMQVSCSTTE